MKQFELDANSIYLSRLKNVWKNQNPHTKFTNQFAKWSLYGPPTKITNQLHCTITQLQDA